VKVPTRKLMNNFLGIIGIIMTVIVISRCKAGVFRKCLSLSLIPLSCLLCSFIFQNLWAVLAVLLIWLTFPALEVLLRYRNMRIEPVCQLYEDSPDIYHIPNAEKALAELEEEGYEEVDECSWRWEGMNKHFHFYWHPEKRAIASLVICEQAKLVFSYLNIRSYDNKGNSWRTTNFPFSPQLAPIPNTYLKRIPCEETSFHRLQKRHQVFLEKENINLENLIIPEPDNLQKKLRDEMFEQIKINVKRNFIKQKSCGEYHYTALGLLYRWKIAIFDLIRLC